MENNKTRKMTLKETQKAIYCRLEYAYMALSDIINIYVEYKNENKTQTIEYMKIEAYRESLQMYLVNYIVALLGRDRHDKISLYKDIQNKPKINTFYNSNKEMNQMVTLRNKVYSHVDPDIYEASEKINLTYNFFKKCLGFIKELLYPKG